MYSEIYLRLEPLGLERVAAAALAAGHEVRLLDLQIFRENDLLREIEDFRPRAIGLSLNYLANVPEVIDLAKTVKAFWPDCFVFVGGHSGSFVADELLDHGAGSIDCVLRGEGEAVIGLLLEAIGDPKLASLPGVVTASGRGPAPMMLDDLDRFFPARHLGRRRHKYFIGVLDPCASIEFTRGCPWDCSFCSAWTFYGRSYRKSSAAAAAEDMASIAERNVFIVDDVAFIHPEHGFAIGHELEKRNVKKTTISKRAPTSCAAIKKSLPIGASSVSNTCSLALKRSMRKASRPIASVRQPALTFRRSKIARKIGVTVAINLIAEPDWDERRFEVVREWALSVPEVVHLTVATPYPGTETWLTESRQLTTLDYRLFDIQHAVLPTRLPLPRFYEELVKTQNVLNRKHLGLQGLKDASASAARLLLRGQTNFLKMLFKFNQVYNADRQYRDHFRELRYAMRPPRTYSTRRPDASDLYIHPAKINRAPVNGAAPLANGANGKHAATVTPNGGPENKQAEPRPPAGGDQKSQ